ncbi:unnamed protein product [Ostreobium quekettii]|uniref:Uncharacterized protein n=1 Tax=Ostreobium quekettii TaxID=121088 RepID=A0A8S1ISE0_9CHLO|nr:unnamed protein product [Ostreobium quekettii]|eukprot:evm.model.scf_42.19 EVM.evm.TU.scf_42.19   scf_42:154623-158196(+)
MVRLTMIARISDGLPLAEGLDNDKALELEEHKHQAKKLMKRLSQERQTASRMSIDSGKFSFHILIEGVVCYMTVAEKSYPKKLAFQYLDELLNEFQRLYGQQIETVARPYAFIKFDTFIQKTKKLYLDTRTQRNMAKLNEELSEVHQIMTKSIQEVLGQGERLNKMVDDGRRLKEDSSIYARRAKDLHTQALIRKWMPLGVVIAVVLMVLYLRSLFY